MPELPDTRQSLLQLWSASGQDLDVCAEEVPAHLLTKPLRRLSLAELCYLLEQQAGLEFLAPLAVEKLQDDPLVQAHQYPGDLLVALLETRSLFWRGEHTLWLEVIALLETAVTRITRAAEQEELGEYLPAYLGDNFMGALLHFRGIHEA